MTGVYLTRSDDVYEAATALVSDELKRPVKILKTPEGKPYVGGNEIFLSISHSKKRGVVALSKTPVGVDLEFVKNKDYPSVLSRMTDRERGEITSPDEFFIHWTAKEAFIKMHGYTLARELKFIEYFGGEIYFKGKKQPCKVEHYKLGKTGILAVCK